MVNPASTYISGWASYHPEGRLTNDDLVATIDTSHEWLDSRLGTRERRIAGPDQTLTDMAEISARAAIATSPVDIEDLDLLIGSSSFDDMVLPALASRVGDRVGTDAYAFDVQAACSGWFVGLDVATTFIETGRADDVLVVAGELTRTGVDRYDRDGVVFFGDATAAGIVQRAAPSEGLRVLAFERTANNSLHHTVEVPTGGHFRTDGPLTRAWVETAVQAMARRMLEAHDLRASDLRALVCHQANLRLVEHLAAQLGVDEARHWHNVEWAGNTAAAGAASALFEGIERNRGDLRDGDLLLVVTVGAGLNGIAVLLQWVSDRG